jgi:hypothetical protein
MNWIFRFRPTRMTTGPPKTPRAPKQAERRIAHRSAHSYRPRHGAQVASQQSPILQSGPKTLNQQPTSRQPYLRFRIASEIPTWALPTTQ